MERPQKEFPLMEEYRKHFEITDDTIFTLYPDIYANNKLTPDLIAHEMTHIRQQEKQGVKSWVDRYLSEPQFRITQELEAYRNQIQSIKDKNARYKCRIWASETLSSGLYGNVVDYQTVFNLLK